MSTNRTKSDRLQEGNHTFSDYLRRTDVLSERLSLKLSEMPEVLGISKAMLFAYRKGTNRITNKVWLRLEAAEQAAGIGRTQFQAQEQYPATLREEPTPYRAIPSAAIPQPPSDLVIAAQNMQQSMSAILKR